jgi:hypothetical protein
VRRPILPVLALLLAAMACQEKLTTPVDCPELCPGASLTVRDTVLLPLPGLDSTYTGYLSQGAVPALLVSDSLPAGEARSFADFPRQSDSITVDGLPYVYTTDSVSITFHVIARDTAVRDVRLLLYRVSPFLDTLATFAAVDSALTPAVLVDSISVLDTLTAGAVSVVLSGDDLGKLVPFDGDSGRIGLGLRVHGSAPTGVRLGSLSSSGGEPTIVTYAQVGTPDTTRRHQTLTRVADTANYVMNGPPPPDPGLLYVGGKNGARTLLRFAVPPSIKDSAEILRATLELTPASAILGLPNDPGSLQLRGVLTDQGAKSPALGTVGASLAVAAGATAVQSADVRSIVATWFSANPPAPAIFIGLSPEGGSFTRPEFLSTAAPSGGPRLRITYALPSHPGHP